MLGEKVKRARLDAGLSQAALAVKIQKDKSWVSKLEKNVFEPSYGAIRDLVAVLPLDPRCLFPPSAPDAEAS